MKSYVHKHFAFLISDWEPIQEFLNAYHIKSQTAFILEALNDKIKNTNVNLN